jgi:hypothetical protein
LEGAGPDLTRPEKKQGEGKGRKGKDIRGQGKGKEQKKLD